MKRAFVILIVLVPALVWAQTTPIRLYADMCRYYKSRTGEPFLQIYLGVPGNTLTFKQEADERFQAQVEMDLQLEAILDSTDEIKHRESYILSLPNQFRLPDTTLDSRRRGTLMNIHTLGLTPGRYRLRVAANDQLANVQGKDSVIYEFDVQTLAEGKIGMSDIKWVAGEAPSKEGQRVLSRDELIPMVSNSTFISKDTIDFYQEIYRADQVMEDKFMIRCVVYRGENRLWGTETRGQWRSPKYFNAYREAIDISQLSSGIYQLQVELLDQKNRLFESHRETFYVYNSAKDAESNPGLALNSDGTDIFNKYSDKELDYYLQTLFHIATEQEANFMKVLETFDQKKNFLYSFLDKRRKTNQKVLDLWNGHLAALEYANQEFKSSFREGWQTDRGRVFLRYGIPEDVERHPSKPHLLPYETWRYNRLGRQTNVVFIFYDPDLATNEYPLLHSTKYGEENNPRWRSQLSANNAGLTPQGIDYERDRTNRFNQDIEIDR